MKTAQLGRILWRQKFVTMLNSSALDFMCVFRTYVRPEYVLQPNVSLYAISTKEAIFVETPDRVNIYSSDVHPFFLAAQYLNATKVIKMPIRDFVSLADRVGDPTVPVIWMSNTGRCGGTMLCQVFESVPGTLAMHQPGSPTNVYVFREYNKINEDDYKVILKSMIRILCKPYPGIERICIKPRPPCTTLMTDISKLCRDVRQIFIYRNSLDTIKSYLAVLASDPYPFVMRACADAEWFSKVFPYFRNNLLYYLISKRKDLPDVPQDASIACVASYAWANQIRFARDAMSRDHHILPVKYEDILSRPSEALGHIFQVLGIDNAHLDRALSSLSRDSQRGSDLSRDKVRDTSIKCMSTTDKIRSDAILSKYNLPRMGKDFRIWLLPL